MICYSESKKLPHAKLPHQGINHEKSIPPRKLTPPWLQSKTKNRIDTIKNDMEITDSTFFAFLCVISIVCVFFATRSDRSEFRPRRRIRRGQPRHQLVREGTCFWCGSLVAIGGEVTPLLGHADCPCMRRGMPPAYRTLPRELPPPYVDEEMAPPYEP